MATIYRVLKTDSGIKLSSGCSSCDRNRVLQNADNMVFFSLKSDWMEPNDFNTYIRGLLDSNRREKNHAAKVDNVRLIKELRSERNRLTRKKILNLTIGVMYTADRATFAALLEKWQERRSDKPEDFAVSGYADDSIITGTKYPNGSMNQSLMIETIPQDEIANNSRVTLYNPPKERAAVRPSSRFQKST